MSERFTATLFIGFAFLLPNCSGDGSGDGGGGGGSSQDGGGTDAADEVAEGPWECLEDNVARRKSDGDTGSCGLVRCTVDDGCGNTAAGCKGDEECVSSTAEAGWEVDIPVHCTEGMCAEEVN